MNFTCPACGYERELPERAHGRKFVCTRCKSRIRHLPDGRFEAVQGGSPGESLTAFDTPAAGSDPALSGHVIGPYRLVSQIGRGSQSQVYLAEHQSLHRRMALKLYSQAADVRADVPPEQVARLVGVDHPNVVRVYDFGTEKGAPYIAMDYLDGPSLEQTIAKAGSLRIDVLIKAAGDVLSGLEALHGAGVIHGSLKPSNVLFHRDGRAALADFGLGHPPGREDGGDVAAPELAAGRPADVRSDLYAAGATLYKAATGKDPFPGASAKERLNKQLYEPLPPPSTLKADIPVPLEALIVSLLHKEPGERPPSAREARSRLGQIAAERASVRGNGTALSPRQLWQAVAAGAAVAFLVTAAVLFFALRAGEEEDGPVVRTFPREATGGGADDSSRGRGVPSVLELTQGSYVSGLVEETGDAYRVLIEGRAFVVQKGDVLRWHRTSEGMAAEAEQALHRAREFYLNSSAFATKEGRLSALQQAEERFAKARDGFITTRRYFTGGADAWLDGRLAACEEGLGLVARTRASVLAATAAKPAPDPKPLPPPEPAKKPEVEPAPPPKPATKVPEPAPPPRRVGSPGRKLDPRMVRALVWLGRHQHKDGSWRVREHPANCPVPGSCGAEIGHGDFDVGVTGLAVLSILGSGIGAADDDAYDGVNIGEALRGGLAYLVRVQGPDGGIGAVGRHKHIYNQAVATFALAEGSRSLHSAADPEQSKAVSVALGRAVSFLAYAQNPGKGWRYAVQSGDNDSSVTALCLLALDAAARARANVPSAAFKGGLAWFEEATEPAYGRVGYTQAGTGKVFIPGKNENFDHHETLAAAAWVCRAEISNRRIHPPLSIIQILHNDRPGRGANARDAYYWYYATRFFRLAGGRDLWEQWRRAVVDALSDWQERDSTACTLGSWPPNGRWSWEGGRVYTTALNLLTLEYALLGEPFRFPSRPATREGSESAPEPAWTFYLKNGGRIRALSYEEDGNGYRLKIRGGSTFVPKDEVEKIVKVGE